MCGGAGWYSSSSGLVLKCVSVYGVLVYRGVSVYPKFLSGMTNGVFVCCALIYSTYTVF